MCGSFSVSPLLLTATFSEKLIPILIGVFSLIAVGLVVAAVIVIKHKQKNGTL